MRVIAFSLFGPDGLYQAGAVANAEIAADLYPGWTCRFYAGASIPVATLDKLTSIGDTEVELVREPENWWSTFWRFRALLDGTLDAVMFRDCDSRPDNREAAAVAEWITLGCDAHIMRDHPKHGMPILAGLWGVTAAGSRRIRHLLPAEPGPVEQYLADQFWLRDHVYEQLIDHAMVHASPASPPMADDVRADFRDWPTPREPGRFVGQGFTADGTPRIPDDALLV